MYPNDSHPCVTSCKLTEKRDSVLDGFYNRDVCQDLDFSEVAGVCVHRRFQ